MQVRAVKRLRRQGWQVVGAYQDVISVPRPSFPGLNAAEQFAAALQRITGGSGSMMASIVLRNANAFRQILI